MFIDGIPQLESPHVIRKPAEFQVAPKVPNWDQERKQAIKHEGLQPLMSSKHLKNAVFINVQTIYQKDSSGLGIQSQNVVDEGAGVVVVVNGTIICQGQTPKCAHFHEQLPSLEQIDLEGGVLAPGLLTYGGSIGLVEIDAEASTNDGVAYAPFEQDNPTLMGDGSLLLAADGLQFKGRNALYVYKPLKAVRFLIIL